MCVVLWEGVSCPEEWSRAMKGRVAGDGDAVNGEDGGEETKALVKREGTGLLVRSRLVPELPTYREPSATFSQRRSGQKSSSSSHVTHGSPFRGSRQTSPPAHQAIAAWQDARGRRLASGGRVGSDRGYRIWRRR